MFHALFYIVGLVLALNRVRERCVTRSLPVPEGTKSGDPVLIGSIPGVALIDRGKDTAGEATVQMGLGSFEFDVKGEDAEGNQAIEPGDPVYIDGEGNLSADAGGTLFGYAMEAVGEGATTAIEVKLAAV